MSTDNVFASIVWPSKPNLGSDDGSWETGMRIVEMLCLLGKPIAWHDGRGHKEDPYELMPYDYLIDGLTVRYMPHIPGAYIVDGHYLKLPTSKEEILKGISIIKALNTLKV